MVVRTVTTIAGNLQTSAGWLESAEDGTEVKTALEFVQQWWCFMYPLALEQFSTLVCSPRRCRVRILRPRRPAKPPRTSLRRLTRAPKSLLPFLRPLGLGLIQVSPSPYMPSQLPRCWRREGWSTNKCPC